MKAIPSLRAFSLTELLLGIAVVAIVAAVIVPKFLNIQSQANATVAQQMAAELNNTYGSWKAAGGVLTGPTANAGSVILSLLGGYNDVGSQPVSVSAGNETTGGVVTASDPVGNATLIRATLPAGITIDPTNPSSVVPAGDFIIIYNSSGDNFVVLPGNIHNGSWCTFPTQNKTLAPSQVYTSTADFQSAGGQTAYFNLTSPPIATIPLGQSCTSYSGMSFLSSQSSIQPFSLENFDVIGVIFQLQVTNLGSDKLNPAVNDISVVLSYSLVTQNGLCYL